MTSSEEISEIEAAFEEKYGTSDLAAGYFKFIFPQDILMATDSVILLKKTDKETGDVILLSVLPNGQAVECMPGKFEFGNTNFRLVRTFALNKEGKIILRDFHKDYDPQMDKFTISNQTEYIVKLGKTGVFKQIK